MQRLTADDLVMLWPDTRWPQDIGALAILDGRGLFDPDVVKPMVKTLNGLQDVLGTHQDREVQADHLRSLADELAGGVGGPEALMVLGVLVDRLEAEQRAARSHFAERFAAFAAKDQRKLVSATFRGPSG